MPMTGTGSEVHASGWMKADRPVLEVGEMDLVVSEAAAAAMNGFDG